MLTKAQSETLEMLLSQGDNLKWEHNECCLNSEIVFEFEGVDGPACGYIGTDGVVDWIAGG